MDTMEPQIISLTTVYSTVYSGAENTSKLRVAGLCAGNSPGTGEFSAQMASYAENVSTWWRHHNNPHRNSACNTDDLLALTVAHPSPSLAFLF